MDILCSFTLNAGAIRDCLVGEVDLAEYFLSIFNLSDEYKKWAKLSLSGADDCSELERRQKRQYLTDHTQVSSLTGNLYNVFLASMLYANHKLHCILSTSCMKA